MLDTAEKWLRRAGAIGALILIGTVYLGLWRASRRPKGLAKGPAPFLLGAGLPVSLASLGLFYHMWRPLPPTFSMPARVAALIAGTLLYFPGLALILWGRLALGEMYNVSSYLGVQLYANHRLVTSGPFALVRHPMYLGAQIAALGSLLIYRTWATLFFAVAFPSLMLRARREEEALAAEFGDRWTEYCRKVPFWMPRVRV